jgi:hypothetical protein
VYGAHHLKQTTSQPDSAVQDYSNVLQGANTEGLATDDCDVAAQEKRVEKTPDEELLQVVQANDLDGLQAWYQKHFTNVQDHTQEGDVADSQNPQQLLGSVNRSITSSGQSALHISATRGFLQMAQTLVDKMGAIVDITDEEEEV